MIPVETDGFRFEFDSAIEAFVFDEKDQTKHTFHGMPMKGVDIVAEFEEAYVYVEIKEYKNEGAFKYDITNSSSQADLKQKQECFKWLKEYLKYKFRDSYLYRHAEGKVDKPIHYICLLTFDNALNSKFSKSLKQELPVGSKSIRWNISLAKSCQVLNVERWNQCFPKWPVSKVT